MDARGARVPMFLGGSVGETDPVAQEARSHRGFLCVYRESYGASGLFVSSSYLKVKTTAGKIDDKHRSDWMAYRHPASAGMVATLRDAFDFAIPYVLKWVA